MTVLTAGAAGYTIFGANERSPGKSPAYGQV